MTSDAIKEQLEALSEKLAGLEREADEATSTSASLKQHLEEAEGRLALKRREINDYERAVAEKEAELREARREESAAHHQEAAGRLAESISQVLVRIEEYEAAAEDLSRLDGSRAASRPALPGVLQEPWEQLKETVQKLTDIQFADELVEAAAQSRMPDAVDALPAHLREAARARIQVRKRARRERA
jgi:chromosome segregation ATPase